MKKKLLLTLWILIPIVLLAYHYGPGQKGLARDRVVDVLKLAQQAEADGSWTEAVEAYAKALTLLPPDEQTTRYKVQLAHADARIWTGELPEAIQEMEGLLDDLKKASATPDQLREVRGKLATAQYYEGWLMRLEGAAADEWTIPLEESRQNFKLLAEHAEKRGESTTAETDKKNLEAVIRLARMDMSELQALPLPKKCQGCKNCSQKCRSQREAKCKNPNPSEKEKKDARGAGVGKRPEGSGS